MYIDMEKKKKIEKMICPHWSYEAIVSIWKLLFYTSVQIKKKILVNMWYMFPLREFF